MQYCPAKARKILQNEQDCPAYTNTRVGKYAASHARNSYYVLQLMYITASLWKSCACLIADIRCN